jgi:hypothetical protein
VIDDALDLLPVRIRERAACHFVIGADIKWIGLNYYKDPLYKTAACAVWARLQTNIPRSNRVPTVAFPKTNWISYLTVLHELGHIVEEQIDWDHYSVDPVSEYAKTNEYESFAEAFALWYGTNHLHWKPFGDFGYGKYHPEVLARDERTLSLFRELAA